MSATRTTRALTCCGGTTDGNATTHEPWCPAIIRAALSWIEDTPHGDRVRKAGLDALDALLERVDN